MKFIFAMLVLFAVVGVRSQTIVRTQTTPGENDMNTLVVKRLMQRPTDQSLLGLQALKPNEIKMNGVTYSGIFVQLSKTDKPLQLINPAAGPEYGSSEDNTARDPITGNATGVKLFSIQF
jgi:hypothetical protein